MKIAFVWKGIKDPKIFNAWQDGLRKAIELLQQEHDVKIFEPEDNIKDVDIILYWESPLTINHPYNGVYYNKVRFNDIKKILLFSGGPIKKEWVSGFDLLLLESKINEVECQQLGIPYRHAFGINDIDFTYEKLEKRYDGMLHGTCASWKRQWLIGEALGKRAMVCGKYQTGDSRPFDECKKFGTTVMPEMLSKAVAYEINSSHTVINTADFHGGGQRATLEAMACGVMPIVMLDSPKNREFVEESGFGLVVEPNAQAILRGVEEAKASKLDPMIGINYVKEKFTANIYKNQIEEAICHIKN